jgi:Ca-activated chloride channel family protein
MCAVRDLRGALPALLLCACGAAAAAGQAPPAGDQIPPDIVNNDSTSVEMVVVPAVVRGRKGLVWDLEREDFSLLVDRRPTPIESFERGNRAPVSLVVLQDLSGSMEEGGKLAASREALGMLVANLVPGDEVALATFAGNRTRVEVPFTADREALQESLDLWEAYGTTALFDAVAWLPHISLASSGARRAALLVTDGVDNASTMAPEEAETIVQRAELPVYVLGMRGERPEPETSPADAPRWGELLERLASATGGRYYAITRPETSRTALAAILTELRHQYVLGFSVQGFGPAAYHPIEVDVRGGKGRRVVHRTGYHGTAPAAAAGGR